LFRVLITPGLVLLWPIALLRFFKAKGGGSFGAPTEGVARIGTLRALHGPVLAVSALGGLAVLIIALMGRPPAIAADSLNAAVSGQLEAIVVDGQVARYRITVGESSYAVSVAPGRDLREVTIVAPDGADLVTPVAFLVEDGQEIRLGAVPGAGAHSWRAPAGTSTVVRLRNGLDGTLLAEAGGL
jgi:hypothetical protein